MVICWPLCNFLYLSHLSKLEDGWISMRLDRAGNAAGGGPWVAECLILLARSSWAGARSPVASFPNPINAPINRCSSPVTRRDAPRAQRHRCGHPQDGAVIFPFITHNSRKPANATHRFYLRFRLRPPPCSRVDQIYGPQWEWRQTLRRPVDGFQYRARSRSVYGGW